MKTYQGAEAQRHSFLASALEGEWVASFTHRPPYPRGKSPVAPIIEEAGWAPEPVFSLTKGGFYAEEVWKQGAEEKIQN
jgi:hypothetical protein